MLFLVLSKLVYSKLEKEISLFKLNKASQYSDMLTKIIKENSDIFSNFTCENSFICANNSIKSPIFPSCLKYIDVTPLYKKTIGQ